VLNLTSPHKTRFQHQLVGFDADWIDAEGRHSAFYTNLPPRDYVFRVMATGADGILATPAAEWRFTILPMFHQTWWFAIACLAATGLTIGAAWRVHVLRVRQQFALLLSERARLSREVHDTLLQSMFGFALQCDALAEAVPPAEHQLRQRLGRLRHDVEDHIREARQSIWNLRSPHSENQSFAAAFREAAELAVASVNSRFSFELIGTPGEASADVEEQLMRIGREAISNAVRHAQASSITASLAYEDSVITLTVADDGRGFEPVTPSQRSDHFGLTSMRERAELVGGALRIESRPGGGTSVTAVIPTRKT
jgi:signal transduction histidine kinase